MDSTGIKVKAGDYVEVRTREEILATLDEAGTVDRLPFMPEMLEFCGRRLRVTGVAHKTCDTITQTGGRRMMRAVHLEGARCDGSAHGGCQAGCLLFWKEEWLKPVGGAPKPLDKASGKRCDEEQLRLATSRRNPEGGAVVRYRCQATELLAATEPLPWWDLRQYAADIKNKNVSVGRATAILALAVLHRIIRFGVGYSLLTSLYDRVARATGGCPYPFRSGRLTSKSQLPPEDLDLQPGETVRIRPFEEILSTITANNKNRGLSFDAEMVPYCGRTYRVRQRVDRIIHESTGEMLRMKAPCIILEDVYCRSVYSPHRLLCPRAIYSYWRESWLERIADQRADGRSSSD